MPQAVFGFFCTSAAVQQPVHRIDHHDAVVIAGREAVRGDHRFGVVIMDGSERCQFPFKSGFLHHGCRDPVIKKDRLVFPGTSKRSAG